MAAEREGLGWNIVKASLVMLGYSSSLAILYTYQCEFRQETEVLSSNALAQALLARTVLPISSPPLHNPPTHSKANFSSYHHRQSVTRQPHRNTSHLKTKVSTHNNLIHGIFFIYLMNIPSRLHHPPALSQVLLHATTNGLLLHTTTTTGSHKQLATNIPASYQKQDTRTTHEHPPPRIMHSNSHSCIHSCTL